MQAMHKAFKQASFFKYTLHITSYRGSGMRTMARRLPIARRTAKA